MTKQFKSILIANRGEIAVRIIRAARELGIKTIAIYSDVDRYSMHVQMADEAYVIGPAEATKSYLNKEAILHIAKMTGVEAIHPGYGFLSENPEFADTVNSNGLIFIGPSGRVMRMMGDKASARRAAMEAGVPVVPGSSDIIVDLETAKMEARTIGYPIIIKATAGGGGRGIRVCSNEQDLMSQWPIAYTEALAAFGNGATYLERFIPHARHIEVQILGDGQRCVHLFERECSLQRRRQKLWEETPSPNLNEATRQALCDSAVLLAEAVGYSGAGTIEYVYDERTDDYFFIEMNTRIQVEHGITECVTGIDLIREMLVISAGGKISLQQDDVRSRGAAIEVRINAEDPDNDFRPNIGRIIELNWPAGPGIRVDSMLYPNYEILPYYDSMIGKLIVYDENRELAINRLQRALSELRIQGLTTTTNLYSELVLDERIRNGTYDTAFLESWLGSRAVEIR